MVKEVCYAYNFTHKVYNEDSLNRTILCSKVNGVNVGVDWDYWNLVGLTQERVDYWRKLGKIVSVMIYGLPNNVSEQYMRMVCQLRDIEVLFIDCIGGAEDYYMGLEDWVNRFNEIAKEQGLTLGIYHGDGLIKTNKTKIDSEIPIFVENLYMNVAGYGGLPPDLTYLDLPNPLWMQIYISEKGEFGRTTGDYLKALYHSWEKTLPRIDTIVFWPAFMPNWELNSDQIEGVMYWLVKLGIIIVWMPIAIAAVASTLITILVGLTYYLTRKNLTRKS